MEDIKKDAQENHSKERSITIEDIDRSVGIIERLAKIFISIFSIFKSKEK